MIRHEIQETGKSTAIEHIKASMKNEGCSCKTKNPKGACCLGDVQAAIDSEHVSLQKQSAARHV
ncbi:hypothetical protein [Ereboglobus sp. PH5-10]|uniref:hypothetical protein n=1 Tax=Ereboglobus sp. PH5-10 TaxID=2940629 RepID=UPI0024067085|nr:hypothetical protein [Ereboglobus sp. PH5-10]